MLNPVRTCGDVLTQHGAAWNSVAVYDSSTIGRIKASGADVLDLVNRLSTNAVGDLLPGEGAPTVLTTDKGRIVDLIKVANLGEYVLFLTSPNMAKEVVEWIDKYTFVEDVTLEDITACTAMASVIGPESLDLLGDLTGVELDCMLPYGSSSAAISGVSVHLLKHGLKELPGCDIVVGVEGINKVFTHLLEAGAVPIGLEAWQVLRVELGVPSYGSELSETYNPLEAGLEGAISFSKGCYIGQEVIARLDTYNKIQRRLVSLRFASGTDVRPGTRLVLEEKDVGSVTSVACMPTSGESIGLGYVRSIAAYPGMEIGVVGTDRGSAIVIAVSQSITVAPE